MNIENKFSPQLTSETSFGSNATNNSIYSRAEKVNTNNKKRNGTNTRGSKSSTISLRDETVSINSIHESAEKINTFEKNNLKKSSNERFVLSVEPGYIANYTEKRYNNITIQILMK